MSATTLARLVESYPRRVWFGECADRIGRGDCDHLLCSVCARFAPDAHGCGCEYDVTSGRRVA